MKTKTKLQAVRTPATRNASKLTARQRATLEAIGTLAADGTGDTTALLDAFDALAQDLDVVAHLLDCVQMPGAPDNAIAMQAYRYALRLQQLRECLVPLLRELDAHRALETVEAEKRSLQ